MKNLIVLALEAIEMFGIDLDVSGLRIFTDDSKESVIKISSKHSVEDKWDDGSVEKFLQGHPAARISLGDSWTLRVVVPEWYSGVTDLNLRHAEIIAKNLPGNVKSYEVRFDNPITLSDFKYYAVRKELVELEDTDFSESANDCIICSYNCQRSVSITLDADKKSGIITIIDHR